MVNLSNRYKVIDCGLTRYGDNYELQKKLFNNRIEGGGEDTLLVTRHKPVVTIGKSGSEEDLLINRDALIGHGVEFVEISRGGGITYHGPGQLVLYPIFDLRKYGKDLRDFVRRLGLVAERVVESFGLSVEFREDEEIGLWVRGEAGKKLASLGRRVKKWYTMHGIALNVSLNKDKARLIRPCGVGGAELVSIDDFVEDVELTEVKELLLEKFAFEFSEG